MNEEDSIFAADEDVITSPLPASSTDLPIPGGSLIPLLSVYRVLCEHYKLGHLSFEEVCSALVYRDHNTIVSDVHIALLDSLLAAEVEIGKEYSAYELASLEKLDEVTWPNLLRLYLKGKADFSGDYYSQALDKRIKLLLLLTSDIHEFDSSAPSIYNAECLGTDSRGARFWFVSRRLIVATGDDVRYYSNKEKLDELLPYFNTRDTKDKEIHDQIKLSYYDYVEQMNETLIDFVLAYKTSQFKSLASPTKYSGITYGDQGSSTVNRKDVENMPMSSLLSLVRQANEEAFSFGTDRLYLKYKTRASCDKLTAALTHKFVEMGKSVRETLQWKSAAPDQVKLMRNTLLEMSSKIPKYFMHDAWTKRVSSWESAVLKAGNAHHLAACLAFLESHIRPVIFKPEWTKIEESDPLFTDPFADDQDTKPVTDTPAENTPDITAETPKTPNTVTSTISQDSAYGSQQTPDAQHTPDDPQTPDSQQTPDAQQTPTITDNETQKTADMQTPDVTQQTPDTTNRTPDSSDRGMSKRKNNLYRQYGEEYREKSGYGWSYGTELKTSPTSTDKTKKCERLTRIVNKLQCTKGSTSPTKRVISMRHGFKKIVSADGKVMFALPLGAKIIRKSVTQVIMSANSLTTSLPTTLQVIEGDRDENKENQPENTSRNIVLSPEVVQSLLKRPDIAVKGNVTLKRRVVAKPAKQDDPAVLLQLLFQSWGSQQKSEIGPHLIPEHRQRKLGRQGGKSMLDGYLYNDTHTFCVPTCQNTWRMGLRKSGDVADVASLISILYSHVRWSGIQDLTVLTENKYVCGATTSVQRIIVDSRADGANELVRQYKIVVMKQEKEGEGLQDLEDDKIKLSMMDLDVGVHDIWVKEDMISINELYTYQHNQDKLKSIESAKILEEKKKTEAEEKKDDVGGSLLPDWKSDETDDKKYFVDSEISVVVRRVLSNILDRVEIEDKRDRERKGKRRKTKKPSRLPGRTADEKEQIRYFGKIDILLGRRKESLKKSFFKKRQYLAQMIREDIKFEEAENKRIEDKIRREEEADMALKRKKSADADRRKKDKEKKIRKAQDKIEKKLQLLQKNDIKESGSRKPSKSPRPSLKSPGRGSLKSPARPTMKSPGRLSLKSPRPKKSSIKIDSNVIKPVYKNKLQPKTKFKFPPKKPVVKKATGKLSLTPTPSRKRDIEKILGKRKARSDKPPAKKLCVEITPVRLSKRNKAALEQRLNRYQRTIAKSLTTSDISHPVIDLKKNKLKLKARPTASSVTERNTIRERLQKLRKIASAKNRGNEVLAKLLMKQELVKKLAAQKGDKSEERRGAVIQPPKDTTTTSTNRGVNTSTNRGVPNTSGRGAVVNSGNRGVNTSRGVMQHHKDITNKSAPNSKKKDTLYCICKRPYDHTRFYIGCDVCSNWYHGKCVAISPSMARNMSGYTCEECKGKSTAAAAAAKPAAKPAVKPAPEPVVEPEGDLFCICKTPYNQYSFYIGCDSCQEWYHGTCVGISEMEAEKIEVYICDRCKQQQGREEPKLTHIQIAGLIKILRELQMHKMSWPFREPAKTENDTDSIKEPMDLSTIHKKFQKKHYPKLTLFVKDVLRVFSNARQMYSEDSQRGRCADTLERYFVAKLNEFKLRHGLS